jgi:type II restriction enzyme
MAKSDQLRATRAGTVINKTSTGQEKEVIEALKRVESKITAEFKVTLDYKPQWHMKDIVADLKLAFPEVDFFFYFESSSLRPDGGVMFLVDRDKKRYPILIGEVKNQGTNDKRAMEGLPKQAKGNAIERLGKNVIGLRTALITESIFPFVCFGYGCDFAPDSSILDRVVTIAMFGKLNCTNLHRQGPSNEFNRGSFYFREAKWSVGEMEKIMHDIARRSVQYYFSKYGERRFTAF